MPSQQGRSQDFSEGGADVCVRFARANFGDAHLRNGKVEVQIITENRRVLNVASKLKSRFSNKFWNKVSFWLSSKLIVADGLG